MLQQLRTSLNDEFRLATLRQTGLLDSPAEECFDRLTRLAVQLLNAPAALVSVVDEGRQFFKSCVGVSEPLASSRQTPLSHSFCQHVVNTAEPLIVEDARQHPLVWDNLAISDFGVIAYAGIPLITSEGHVLGSFCILGYEPRQWKEQEISILTDLAASVMTEIELRLRIRQLQEQREVSRVIEERFELVARASNEVLWEYDRQAETVWWSENLQLFGYAPEQMHDSHAWKEKIHPEDRERVLAAPRISAEQGRDHWVSEYRFRCADGEYKHVYDRGRVIYDTEQKPVRQIGSIMDITDRKRAEEALRTRERQFAEVQAIAHVGSWEWDVATDQVNWSDEHYRMFGLQQGEFAPSFEGYLERVHPEDRERVRETVSKGLVSGAFEYECRFVLPSGEVRYESTHGQIAFGQDGQPIRGVGTVQDITERKQAEQSLRESEDHYRHTVELNPQVPWTATPDGRVDFGSPRWGEWTANEGLSTAWSQVIHPDDIRRMGEAWAHTMTMDAPYDVEHRVRMRDGSYRWMRSRAFPRRDEEGRIVRWYGATEDIHEHRQAEDALRDSEERFRQLAENIQEVFWITDFPLTQMLYVSPAYEQIWDRSCEALYKNPAGWIEAIHPADRERVIAAAVEGCERGVDIEYRILRPDGELRWIRDRGFPVRNQDGEVYRIAGIAEDVTEAKKVEDALRASEERYRSFFEDDISGDYVATAEGQILACNPAFLRMFGFDSMEEALASNMTSLHLSAEGREAVLELVQATGRAELREWEMRRRDGVSLHVIKNAVGVFDDAGDLVRVRGYIMDITDRKLLEEQLRQSQKMEAVGRLAGGIAHDFNNLLTVITGHTDLLLLEATPEDPVHDDLLRIANAAQRSASLTRQLLAFSRKQILQPKTISVNEIVRGMEGMLRRLIGEHISVVTTPSLAPVTVSADPGQIEQVLMNLAVNARDAMPEGGILTIQVRAVTLSSHNTLQHGSEIKPGRYAMLSVSDSGYGMDGETLSHIFEPFFTTKEVGNGTGLGLSTVYGIVKQSGGYIFAESEPGRGSTFKIYLPLVEQTVPEGQAASGDSRNLSRGAETVLVIEDEPAVRSLVSRALRKGGYTVLEAESGTEAVQVAASHGGPVDLLLTDVVMPGMSGRAVADRLIRINPDLRVLFMSGYTDDAIVHHGVLDPDTAFIQKPFSPQALLEKVREVLVGPTV